MSHNYYHRRFSRAGFADRYFFISVGIAEPGLGCGTIACVVLLLSLSRGVGADHDTMCCRRLLLGGCYASRVGHGVAFVVVPFGRLGRGDYH